jgi:hypothetical protein
MLSAGEVVHLIFFALRRRGSLRDSFPPQEERLFTRFLFPQEERLFTQFLSPSGGEVR